MIKWITSIFKKAPKKPLYNVNHPDLVGKFEEAFTCKGVTYYRAIPDFVLPVGRYKWIDAALNEVDIRMTLPVLKAYIIELKKYLNVTNGAIRLDKAFQVISNMETRCELAFEPDTVKRLASIVYFDDTEDLRDYDQEYGQKKIAIWEKNGDYSFFLTRPIGELLNLSTTSETSLKKFIQEASQILKDLTLERENRSLENT
jgi:hypothetical protein